jgi:hypothetical protein
MNDKTLKLIVTPMLVGVAALGIIACEAQLQGFEDLQAVYTDYTEPVDNTVIDPVCAAKFCRSGTAFDQAKCDCCNEARTELSCVCVRNRFDPACTGDDDDDTGGTGGTDTGDTGGVERPEVFGCDTPSRPSGTFGCKVDVGDGKGPQETPFCVPSEPSVQPGTYGYRACSDCSTGVKDPAVLPGKWRGNAVLTATSKTLQQILGKPLELPLLVSFTNRQRASGVLDDTIEEANQLGGILCIDTPKDLLLPGQQFDGWTTYFNKDTGDFRATISGLLVPAGFDPNLTSDAYADVLLEGTIASGQCLIGWVRLFLSGFLGCPSAVELVGPFFAGLSELEPEDGPVYPSIPCLSYDTAKVPGPSVDPKGLSACPSAPAYKTIINELDNPDTGGKGWPACEGKGYCDPK